MRITLFTGNQPRHIALIEALAGVAHQVYAVQECTTAFPGRVEDFFRKSAVMQRYFSHVVASERRIFGSVRFPMQACNGLKAAGGRHHWSGSNDNRGATCAKQRRCAEIRQLALRMGDLSLLQPSELGAAMNSDLFVVFGSSFIRGALCDALVERRAVNIHMGVAPYYRGSSCNFWALRDGHADLVGATIHRLSRGLDSGPILFHAFPELDDADADGDHDFAPSSSREDGDDRDADAQHAFDFGMRAVRAAHFALVSAISDGALLTLAPQPQDRSREIRYSRNAEFTDEAAAAYLASPPTRESIRRAVLGRDSREFAVRRPVSSTCRV